MKTRITLIFVAVVVTFVSGCCVRFSDLTPTTKYHVGDVITTSGKKIAVEQFDSGGGNWVSSGFAEVDTNNNSQGSGNDMNANNVNLRFLFDYPVDKITLKFGEFGGNNNIKVNNDFRNLPVSSTGFVSLNGTMLGGVQVAVNAVPQGNNWLGTMTLEGNINDFSIGGQELWIDDICCDK